MSLSRGGAMNNSRSLVLCVMLASFLAAAEARAKLYFLPDYQNNNYSSRSDSAPSGGGDIGKVDCQTVYGLVSACVAPMVPDAEYTYGKTTCYRCKCPNTYKTSCSSGSHLAGEVCSAGGVNYYPRCDADTCPSGYVAGKTCSQGYNREVNGKAGSQDCARCVAKSCPSGYTAGLANCNSKSFPAGWTYASNGYAGDSICGKCTAKSCAAGYTAGISQCSNTSSWTYGSNGYSGDQVCGKCTAKPCDSGYTAGLENCNGKSHPAGWSFSTGVKSGNTTCGKCTAKTCAAGSTSCAAPTTPVANSYFAGDSQCYTCQTCEQRGLKTCGSSCIAQTECCGGCPNGQACINGTCGNSTLACENYIRSVCTNKCSINGDTFSSGVQTIVLVGKDINLNTLKVSGTSSVTLTSAAEYADTEACAGIAKSKITGTFTDTAGLSSVNFSYLDMDNVTFISSSTGFVFDNCIVENPTFTNPDQYNYSISPAGAFLKTSKIWGVVEVTNGGAVAFEVDPAAAPIALEGVHIKNAGLLALMNSDPGYPIDEYPNVQIRELAFEADSPDNYYNRANFHLMGLNVEINNLYFINYAEVLIAGDSGGMDYYLNIDHLVTENTNLYNTLKISSIFNFNSEGKCNIRDITLDYAELKLQVADRFTLEGLRVNNGSQFNFHNYGHTASILGSVNIDNGRGVLISSPGTYSGSAFSRYIN